MRERTEHLVDPAQGDASHKSCELLTGTQGPGAQQVEGVVLGAAQLHREGRFKLLSRLRHGCLDGRGIEGAGLRLRALSRRKE